MIVVLWACVLISLIVVHLTASGRSELRIAGNLAANAAVQAAADGAVYRAIFNLLDPRPDERWSLDGSSHELPIGDSRVVVRLDDEAARINPNIAAPELMKALVAIVANNGDQADAVVTAIAEWIGANKRSRAVSGRNNDDPVAGRPYDPPGEPLQSIEELGWMRGMTPGLLAALRPHLSLFAPAVPNAERADPVVTRAIAEAAHSAAAATLPPIAEASQIMTARITATALGPENAAANRLAIARVGAGVAHGYAIVAWQSGDE